jgi:heme exporter protein C
MTLNSSPSSLSRKRLSSVLGWSALLALALNLWWGLWLSPPAPSGEPAPAGVVEGQFVRMLYVHPAVATMAYVGYGVCALGSIAWLWPRTRSPRWDRLAVAGAEVGAVFCAATLITGSIWGRASWGVWWTWDARLTLTAILFALSLGYLALRRAVENPHSRSVLSSVVALLMALTVVVDHYATSWFVTLHQGETLFKPDPSVYGWQLATMVLSFVAFGLLCAWLIAHRYRLETLEERYESEAYYSAIEARRSEASQGPGASQRCADSTEVAANPVALAEAVGEPLGGSHVGTGSGPRQGLGAR